MDPEVPVLTILGVPISPLTVDQTLALCEQRIRDRRRLLIGVVNAAKVVNLRRDATLRGAVLAADVILADGMAVVWASRLLGRPVPERVAGIDLMVRLLHRAHQRGYRVYCLGATDAVLRDVVARIERDYPGLQLVGWRNGYFGPDQEAQVAADVARARPDLLFVAMSSPKKELFLARWSAQMGVPVCHGVGGSFDVLAGRVKRAPAAWQRFGLEWFYRVLQEPRRMWRRYLVTNTLFSVMVLRELLLRRDRHAPSGVGA
jgi:N-acetylglucosaminyldiphosphoundecaprenol N-acetyl-beta-D-mannosaminyltransferase